MFLPVIPFLLGIVLIQAKPRSVEDLSQPSIQRISKAILPALLVCTMLSSLPGNGDPQRGDFLRND